MDSSVYQRNSGRSAAGGPSRDVRATIAKLLYSASGDMPHHAGAGGGSDISMVSHGGGFLAFNIWRLDHSYNLRPDLKKIIPQKPSGYLKELYFDSIVHSVAALQYLIQVVGADRVVIGTDYPMAMGDFEPVRKINELNLTDEERSQILGDNAARVLNL